MAERLKDKLKALAAEAKRKGLEAQRCCTPFCPRPVMLSAGVGFDAAYCEYHRARIARHGHAEIPTIRAPTLRPYVETSKRWITAQVAGGNVRVRSSLLAIRALLDTSGNPPPVMDTLRWSADQKAKALLSRLREAGTTPEAIMASAMGVTALLADDTWAPRQSAYRLVQISKAVHRMHGSGTHRRYEQPVTKRVGAVLEYDGTMATVVVSAYSRSEGKFLRVLGKAIDEACGSIAAEQAQAIVLAKEARFGRHPCHNPAGYEPEWRKKDRAKHEAARNARQQQQVEALRAANLRRLARW